MTKLKQPVELRTFLGEYKLYERLGEGGAGRVFGATASDGGDVAVKVLSIDRASTDTKKRFKNETAFLASNDHPNIVKVTDRGLATDKTISGPFYVMPRYSSNLRTAVRLRADAPYLLSLFSQILDGVEAAHLRGAIHRDLKPENILFDETDGRVAIADFCIARFSEHELATLVETAPAKRLANFQYAAPEQRAQGNQVGLGADIYALGLILNEMMTGTVPHGQGYKVVRDPFPEYAFLDQIIGRMLRQEPTQRQSSINEVKTDIQRYRAEAVSLQKLDDMKKIVVRADQITDPLALEPPKIANARWDDGRLYLGLDRPVSREWINAFQNLGNFESIMGAGPRAYKWNGNTASVEADENYAQQLIDFFKRWLPNVTASYRQGLENAARIAERQRAQEVEQERKLEEKKLRINQKLTF